MFGRIRALPIVAALTLMLGAAPTRAADPADSDGDGVPDDYDVCPADKETPNGFEDADGCPDESAAALNDLAQKVFFDTGKASLDGQGRDKVKEVAAYLKAHLKVASIKVLGYADARGVAADNQLLSERRAEAVVAALVGLGVATCASNASWTREPMKKAAPSLTPRWRRSACGPMPFTASGTTPLRPNR